MECFQWSDSDYDLQEVREELADVLVYCRNLLDALELDEDEIVNSKMDQNERKYPVEKARGRSDKYNNKYFEYKGAAGTKEYRMIDGKRKPYSYSAKDDWSIPEELQNEKAFP